jgi:hypothetical protein
MSLNYKLVISSKELIKHKKSIGYLYARCFNKSLNQGLWDWMYLYNPAGEPVVSLCFDGDDLVGHYACIQIPVILDQKRIIALLSVGSMVDSRYRKYGIFVEQGKAVYESCKDRFSLVLGFPNKMALPARKKRLGWTIDEHSFVALLSGKDIIESEYFQKDKYPKAQQEHSILLDVDNHSYLNWRLSKPGTEYIKNKSYISKKFGNNFDIVYHKNLELSEIVPSNSYHIYFDSSVETFRRYKAFDYPFGYKFLNGSHQKLDFERQLLFSDVF